MKFPKEKPETRFAVQTVGSPSPVAILRAQLVALGRPPAEITRCCARLRSELVTKSENAEAA